jgi:hypothetical protein
MNHLFEWLIKLLVILMIVPFLVGAALQLMSVMVVAILPWLLLCSVLAGLVAGISGAIVIRRRLPPGGANTPLPPGAPSLGAYRVRRPRGGRTWR